VVLAAIAHLLLLVRVDHVQVAAPGERALAGSHEVPHADLARAASAAVVEDCPRQPKQLCVRACVDW